MKLLFYFTPIIKIKMNNYLLLFILFPLLLYGKSIDPKPIKPYYLKNIKFEVIHRKHENGIQNGGYFKATDTSTGEIIWEYIVYKPGDSDVFITSLAGIEKERKLIIKDDIQYGAKNEVKGYKTADNISFTNTIPLPPAPESKPILPSRPAPEPKTNLPPWKR